MNTTTYLTRDQVPATLRAGYAGAKFQVRVAEALTIPADAGLWDGGSRSTFRLVRIRDGAAVAPVNERSSPWDGTRQDRKVTLEAGIACVEHITFRGKDLGLRFTVHPADAAPLLPAPVDLTAVERLVLAYTAGRRSSYQGKDRYMMARDDARWRPHPGLETMPSRAEWDAAKDALIGRGFLTKAGAITPAGRNAAPRI